MRAGTALRAGLLVERQGIITSIFQLTGQVDRLEFRLSGFALFGVPLPRWLAPSCIATEAGRGGSFTFDITVDLPLIGRLIHYRGELAITS